LTAFAVNVTCWPGQIVVCEALIVTAGVTLGVTDITTGAEVIVVGFAQELDEVNVTVMASPFANVES
jgi:hypothetical protein